MTSTSYVEGLVNSFVDPTVKGSHENRQYVVPVLVLVPSTTGTKKKKKVTNMLLHE